LNQPDVRPRIAVIPGDGVGPEVVRVARDLMIQAAASVGVTVQTEEFGWGSEHYLAHGRAMPGDAADVLRAYEAVLFGSLGTPSLPDSEVVWSLIELRKQLDLGANVRPVERWPGIPSRFVDGLTADFVVVRENTEGEYSGIGGRSRISNVGNIAIAVAVHSETTIAALARYAFGLARTRRNLLTLISKANAIHHAFSLWEEVVADVATEFSDVRYEVSLVDAAAARMIQNPESFDVLLTSNLFGSQCERRNRWTSAGSVRADPRFGTGHRRAWHSESDWCGAVGRHAARPHWTADRRRPVADGHSACGHAASYS
jgi:tartrate dehydrogenase/decarboxylase/D-malate dehydrogenase